METHEWDVNEAYGVMEYGKIAESVLKALQLFRNLFRGWPECGEFG